MLGDIHPPARASDQRPASAVERQMWTHLLKRIPLWLVILFIATVGAILVIAPFVNGLLVYNFSAWYVGQVAEVYDLNRHLAMAFTFAGVGLIVLINHLLRARKRWKRIAGAGTLLSVLIFHSLVLWHITREQPFGPDGKPTKCYVATRTAIIYRERPGFDPSTGLACHPVTPDIAERIREYQSGRRPSFLVAEDPVFFDPRTGSPVVWYSMAPSGQVELFDLMGFHPRSGVALQPITREIVAQWHKQTDEQRRERSRPEPQRIDNPENYGFFDSRTGAARLWYSRSRDGSFLFYNSEGFHAATGERLGVVTADIVLQWRKHVEEKNRRQAEEQALQREREDRQRQLALQRQQEEREIADRAERERLAVLQRQREEREKAQLAERERLAILQRQQDERDRADRAEQDRLARLQREQEQERAAQARVEAERQQAAAGECDRLAANPYDQRKAPDVPGAPYDVLRANTSRAIAACQSAVRLFPNELRFQYQLARATQVNAPQDAWPMLQRLVSAGYPAAYDNLGGLHIRLRRNYAEAVRLYRLGAQLNDPDSLVSLAEMVERNHFEPRTAAETKLQLYLRAAALGHAGAALAVEQERSRMETERTQRENAERALEMFRGVIQSFPRQ